jgi:hypothetical protein
MAFLIADHLVVLVQHLAELVFLVGKLLVGLHLSGLHPSGLHLSYRGITQQAVIPFLDPVQIVLHDICFLCIQFTGSDPLVDSFLLVLDPVLEISRYTDPRKNQKSQRD